MPETFPVQSDTVASPARRGAVVTPHDVNPIAPPKAILVGTAGNIAGRLVDDQADVVYPVQAGYNPLRFVLIKATGTTAGGIVALY